MRRSVVFMFSGQGSQYYAMGRELYEGEPVFRGVVDEGSALLEGPLGTSLADVIYRHEGGRFDPFDLTRYTHPGLFLFQYAMARLFLDRGLVPDFLLGYSLGEFVAAAVAEVIPWREALLSTFRQAEALERSGVSGGMLAVLAPLAGFEADRSRFPGVSVAAVNTPRHFVLTGSGRDLDELERLFRERQVDSVRLPIRIAFHSPAVDAVAGEWKELLSTLEVRPPRFPLVSARWAGIVPVAGADSLWGVTRGPVQFQRTVDWMEERGPHSYVDLGPSGTLASFVRTNTRPGSASLVFPVVTPFARDAANLATVEAALRVAEEERS